MLYTCSLSRTEPFSIFSVLNFALYLKKMYTHIPPIWYFGRQQTHFFLFFARFWPYRSVFHACHFSIDQLSLFFSGLLIILFKVYISHKSVGQMYAYFIPSISAAHKSERKNIIRKSLLPVHSLSLDNRI